MALVFLSMGALADQTTIALHSKVSKLLAKHALTKTSGNLFGYKTKTNIIYQASRCELRITRRLEWRHISTGVSTDDHGASYRIPLDKVQLDKGAAANRLKLLCNTDDCIEKLLHRKCKSSRHCRRNRTVNSYYLQIDPQSKQDLAANLQRLVASCGSARVSTASKITY